MADKVRKGVDGDGERAGADRQMRARHPDEIDHQRDGEYRTTTAVGQRGGNAHIPTQRDRKFQRSVKPNIYRQRNFVERFFCKLGHFRRIATRYDKLASNFLAAVALVAARLWLPVYESTT